MVRGNIRIRCTVIKFLTASVSHPSNRDHLDSKNNMAARPKRSVLASKGLIYGRSSYWS